MKIPEFLLHYFAVMILSHKYKFIFIKTNKTAGTSVEIALSRFCGENDIISPNESADEQIRREIGARPPQNYLAPWYDYRWKDVYRLLQRRKKKERFYNHMSAAEIKAFVGDDIWNSYFKFCFERNPWDRVISFYYWRHRNEPRPSITEFIDSGIPMVLHKYGLQRYAIDGHIAVDRVCRFENLEAELREIGNVLGFPEEPTLPKAKASFRKDKRSYRDILNTFDREKIRRMFATEIALFGYEF